MTITVTTSFRLRKGKLYSVECPTCGWKGLGKCVKFEGRLRISAPHECPEKR